MVDSALHLAVQTIAGFEGFRSHPYQDVGGVFTIGYGFTYGPDMRRITAATPPMSQGAALAWLEVFVAKTLHVVRGMVYVPITDNQAAALTSLAFNEGSQAVRDSSLMMALNRGWYQEAADAFLAWVYAGGHVVDGLVTRRKAERALFLTADAAGPQTPEIRTPEHLNPQITANYPGGPLPDADDLNAAELARVRT